MLLACAKLLAAAQTCIQGICCSPALTFVVLQCCDDVSIVCCVLNAQLNASLADSAIQWSHSGMVFAEYLCQGVNALLTRSQLM